ncbi:peroxiredoxin [Devosia sp.]|uniref:peroxiredoxin n=1 Tax=Devosia sp. TaxID=1871048 RepID=UPI003A92B5B5
MPEPGETAPDFALPLDDGSTFTLSSERGHPVVLYFYPQDETEGCTIENRAFTALAPQFAELGVTVIGISPDSVESHCAFRDKHGLALPLAADPDHKVIDAYGLWQLKKMFGNSYMGVKRGTVLIDADGRIFRTVMAPRVKDHADKVLTATREMVATA